MAQDLYQEHKDNLAARRVELQSGGLATLKGPFLNGSGISRRWDLLLVLAVVFGVIALTHITSKLSAGDWDFWADWKDRQWWPLVTPVMHAIFVATFQYIFWVALRLPIGATVAMLLVYLGQLLVRTTAFGLWVYVPVNFTLPAILVPGAVIFDCILLATRSFPTTAVVGCLVWGLTFQPTNAALWGAMWQPVLYNGTVLTVADVLGMMLPRSQTPTYLRIIEQGHFRAFLSQISYVIAFFAGFVSMAFYSLGLFLAKVMCFKSVDTFLTNPGVKRLPKEPVPVVTGGSE